SAFQSIKITDTHRAKPCKDGADFSIRNILDLHLTWSWDSFNLPSLSVAYYSVGHCEIDSIDSRNSGCVLAFCKRCDISFSANKNPKRRWLSSRWGLRHLSTECSTFFSSSTIGGFTMSTP